MDWSTSVLPAQGNTGEGTYATPFVIPNAINYYPNPDGSKATFPTYSLWSPRLAFAYDITGNGRLAIKGSYGRYTGMDSSPNSQPGVGGANPISQTSCTYLNWDGSIPYKPVFGVHNWLGSDTNVNLKSTCGKLQVVNGVASPVASYHWDPNLKSSYTSEFTGSLDIGLSRDYNIRINVQRKFDHNGYKTINLNIPTSAYAAPKCVPDPGFDGRLGTADDNINGPVCYQVVPTSDPRNSAPANTLYVNTDEAHNEGNNSYTAYVFTFNKNSSHRYQYVASYSIDMSHSVNTNPFTMVDGVQYGSPNTVFSNMISAQSPVVWSQSFKANGIYALPDLLPFLPKFHLSGVQYSATLYSQNQGWYGYTSQIKDANGTNQDITMVNHIARYPWFTDWDNEIRKKFKLGEGKQTLEFTWQLANTMNVNTIQSWKSTSTANSSYLQPDKVTPLRPKDIASPRIYEWGVTYRF
jgi:hypothetical protein